MEHKTNATNNTTQKDMPVSTQKDDPNITKKDDPITTKDDTICEWCGNKKCICEIIDEDTVLEKIGNCECDIINFQS